MGLTTDISSISNSNFSKVASFFIVLLQMILSYILQMFISY